MCFSETLRLYFPGDKSESLTSHSSNYINKQDESLLGTFSQTVFIELWKYLAERT